MYNDDWLLREIEKMTLVIGKLTFGKGDSTVEIFDEKNKLSDGGFLYHRLKKLVLEKKINEAENLLFEEIEKNPCTEYLKTAVLFYGDLQAFSDAALADSNFSRQEIAEGLAQIQKLCGEG